MTVAHFVALEDPIENAAVQVARQAAIETNETAGDGTTTSTILARAILQESQKHIAAGAAPIELQRGITNTVKEICNRLSNQHRLRASKILSILQLSQQIMIRLLAT